ncbi:hypothetical protein U1872_17185 [Sphingomonas sp. RB3P16]|uniref:hypothetical protein n=1 Tax=Parasphingomonas frigoris TaxID=3096163 RepID=UPI002FC9B696
MKLDLGAVLRDAWAMAQRDRDLLIGVAGVFLFVPKVAQEMFIAPTPPLPASSSDPVAIQTWLDAVAVWSRQNDLLLLVLTALSLFGSITLFALYADRNRPDVATAMRQGLGLLPRYVLLAFMVTLPVNVASLLLIPGLYLKGRLLTVGPAFVAERPLGVIAAWRRSFALTRGHGLALMLLACVPLIAGDVLAWPFEAIGQTMSGAPLANPVVAAVLDLCSGGARTLGTVASILIEIALYRRLSNGI